MPNSSEYDSDGDAVMRVVHQPVFEFVQAPRLVDWGHSALVNWKQRREQYEERVRQRCIESGEKAEVVMAPIKTSIDPKLLEVLCLYELRKPVDDVTGEQLLMLINQRVSNVRNLQVPDLDAFFKRHLRIDMSEEDIEARVLKYFTDLSKLISDHGLGKILGVGDPSQSGYNERMKLRCTVLMDNLKPAVLRDDVKRHVKYECREAKRNDFVLFGIIKEKAQAQHKYHMLVQEQRSRTITTKQHQKQGDTNTKGAPSSGSRKGNSRFLTSHTSKPDASAPSAKRKDAPPRTGCWVCKGQHWLKDCPTATEADRKAAEERMQALRDGRAKKATTAPGPGEVLINGLITIAYCADSGSDWTYIPPCCVEELKTLGGNVIMERLPKPRSVTVAGGAKVICHDKINLELLLETVARPVHLAEVQCVVMEGNEAEFILGNDTLLSLGIDVNAQLSQVAVGSVVQDEDPFEIVRPEDIDPSDIQKHLDNMIVAAGDNGFDPEYLTAMKDLCTEYEDIFRIDLKNDPPADIEPLRITIREGADPFRAHPRRYGPAQSEILHSHTKLLLEAGFIRRNTQSHWACAAVPVQKPNRPNEFRLTVDYRPVNAVTIPIVGTAPDLMAAARHVEGAYGFAKFDMPSGFWQLPLHPDSQEQMSFVTDDAVYSPTRVPQGATDSALHFQNQMQLAFEDMLYENVLIWIDDILVYERSAPAFLAALRRFFERVRAKRLKLSVVKSCLFKRETKWCGRIFSGIGIQHDPARIETLQTLPLPATAADLQQFICAAGWMRDSIVDYGRLMQPLHEKLEGILKKVGRTKRLAASVILAWDIPERSLFDDARRALANTQLLHFPIASAEVCVFTDASERGWGLIVTQVRKWDNNLLVTKQHHELLLCKSGVFDAAARRWSIIEKEAFPIVWAARHLDYLLVRNGGFRLYCDHKNLIFVFAPDQEVKQHVRGKLQRWALSLTGLPYRIEHIDGSANLWADLLSHWGLPSSENEGINTKCKFVTRSRARELEANQQHGQQYVDQPYDHDELPQRLHLRSGDFVFPSMNEIRSAQAKRKANEPPGSVTDDSGAVLVDGRIWLPRQEVGLLQRIFIVAHCGTQGHRGIDTMVATINGIFAIDNLIQQCRSFLSRCLLCKHVKGGNILPRPWGPTYNATARNELLHWDFLYMGDSMGTWKYVLVLKDGLTHYCELVACDSPTSAVAAAALLDWWKRFGQPTMVISDQGSHFKNDVVSQVCKRLGVKQELVIAYAPWINGSIERLNRHILQVIRVLLMETKLDTREWEYLLPIVQGNLNHTPVASLANKSPLELFTALPQPTPFEPIIVERKRKSVMLTERPAMPTEQLERLRESLAAMHRDVKNEREKRRFRT